MKCLRAGLFGIATLVLASGCKSAPPREPVTVPGGVGHSHAAAGAEAQSSNEGRGEPGAATAGSVSIDERIVRACGDLPDPHFEFDSAAIRGQAAQNLRVVARCFSAGPLAGRSVKLVGRADPRGTEMYNLALGQDRAGSVARFLSNAGVPEQKISTMSRGELDATGVEEAGFARDRRVDIELGD